VNVAQSPPSVTNASGLEARSSALGAPAGDVPSAVVRARRRRRARSTAGGGPPRAERRSPHPRRRARNRSESTNAVLRDRPVLRDRATIRFRHRLSSRTDTSNGLLEQPARRRLHVALPSLGFPPRPAATHGRLGSRFPTHCVRRIRRARTTADPDNKTGPRGPQRPSYLRRAFIATPLPLGAWLTLRVQKLRHTSATARMKWRGSRSDGRSRNVCGPSCASGA
jgi:hypothetical protein